MDKKILFRADGNSEIGLGHLYRLFAIVEMLNDDFEYVFVTSELSSIEIIPKKYNIDFIPEIVQLSEEPDWIYKRYSSKDYIIIADGYQFKSDYQKNIKTKGYKLIYIDDLSSEHMYADIVINHSPHAKVGQFTKEPYTELALGTDFAILRPSFLNKMEVLSKRWDINNAFVCFGGADKHNFTYSSVLELLEIPNVQRINVVVGAAYCFSEIFEIERCNPKVRVFKNLDEKCLFDLMNTCTIAIVPTSTILFELISINMYIVSGYFVENQKMAYFEMEKRNVFKGIGDFTKYNFNFLKKHLLNLSSKDIEKQLNSQKDLIDGKQQSRFLSLINKLK